MLLTQLLEPRERFGREAFRQPVRSGREACLADVAAGAQRRERVIDAADPSAVGLVVGGIVPQRIDACEWPPSAIRSTVEWALGDGR